MNHGKMSNTLEREGESGEASCSARAGGRSTRPNPVLSGFANITVSASSDVAPRREWRCDQSHLEKKFLEAEMRRKLRR